MPGGDRTGPAGMGPMTGRAAGWCAGYGMPGYWNWGGGRGGFGRGRGHRNRYWATGLPGWQRAAFYGYGPPPPPAPLTGEEQLAALREETKNLEESLQGMRERIRELEQETQQK